MCLLVRIVTSFLRYTGGDLNFIKDRINHGLLRIIHVRVKTEFSVFYLFTHFIKYGKNM